MQWNERLGVRRLCGSVVLECGLCVDSGVAGPTVPEEELTVPEEGAGCTTHSNTGQHTGRPAGKGESLTRGEVLARQSAG